MSSSSWGFLVTFILFNVNVFATNPSEKLRDVYKKMLGERFTLLPHKGTYLLPFSYNRNPNRAPYRETLDQDLQNERGKYVHNLETEFQVSFLVLTHKKLFGTNFNAFLGYTQHSWWQLFNKKWSRPFRETNYEPEIFIRRVFEKRNDIGGIDFMAYDLGYVHQSNGQSQALSRSWDRVFVRAAFIVDHLVISGSLWYRIPGRKSLDDNPDLYKYLGYGQLNVRYSIGKSDIGIIYRPGEVYQGADLIYTYPVKHGINLFIKGTYGYGSSLIDYNNKAKTIGIGVSLADPINYDRKPLF